MAASFNLTKSAMNLFHIVNCRGGTPQKCAP